MGVENNNERSVLVTVVAWIFIVFSGFALIILLIQNLIIWLLYPLDETTRIIYTINEAIPDCFNYMFIHLRVILVAFTALSLVFLISSVGLLMRKNWARIIFISMLFLGIAWLVVSSVLQHYLITSIPIVPDSETAAEQRIVLKTIEILMTVMSITIGLFFLWAIRKLTASPIKEEFSKYS